ncbi:hypothetical protein GGR54DRAFT_648120 [Hypoxylon sp. NC1633]|nr:hypothetical protein GGR54DRAFT_648120 [Hypoxylon sp. NC1633]
MADLDSFGLTQLAGGGGPYRVNIIFVHGLRGHLRHTWEGDRKRDEETSAPTLNTLADAAEYPQPKVFWPSEYLKHDIPDARVWTYEYDADTIGGFFQAGNENSIFRRGEDLAMQVSDNIRNEDPILFVAHSLGGLIVKKAICSSEPCRKRTKFIIFLGTPHRGSQYAGWPEIAANLARLALEDSDKDPEVDSEAMDSINEEFKRVVEESGIRICSFQETRGILGMKGPHDKVVDDFSSKLDLPEALETVKSIDADHRQMARCNDRSDPQHAAIASALMQFLRDEVNDGSETKSQESLVAASSEVLVEEESIVGGTTIDHVPPPCYYLPFPENQGFVGRDAILHDLQELLVDDHFNRVAVVGPEGVGKTQVALQLAYWAKKSCPQYSIFWVSARSYAAVVQTYMNIAKKIGIRSADDEDIVEAVRSYLSTEKAGPWLLILDDADNKHISGRSYDSRILHNYLPRSKLGLIVVTTDSNDVAYTIGHGNVIHLDPMDEQEARRLMGEIINKELLPDDDTTTRLLYECRYMPLAITLAASYLYKTHISIKEYLEHLREHWEHLRHEERQEPSGNNRLSQLLNPPLLNIIIDIDHISKSDNAVAELLAFISHIDAKGIPQSLLPKTHSEERLLQAIETLCAYGLLTKREDSAFYDIHNLVQMATRVWTMKHGLVKESTEKAIRHLARLFPSDESKNRNLWREYMPHALRVLEESTYYLEVIYRYDVEERYGYDLEERYKSDLKRYGSDLEDSYELFFRTGQCLQADGRTREAMLHLEACCHWRKAHFAEEHPDRLVSEHALAVAYQANGQVEKATELFNHVEAIRKTLEEEHPDRLGSQHGPGVAQSFSGSVEEVEDSDLELQDNALEDTGQETPSVLSSLWLWLMHIFFPPPTGYQRIPYTCVRISASRSDFRANSIFRAAEVLSMLMLKNTSQEVLEGSVRHCAMLPYELGHRVNRVPRATRLLHRKLILLRPVKQYQALSNLHLVLQQGDSRA